MIKMLILGAKELITNFEFNSNHPYVVAEVVFKLLEERSLNLAEVLV